VKNYVYSSLIAVYTIPKTQLMSELKPYLTDLIAEVDAALDRYLPAENTTPETIHKAMRYSIFAGGKRLRPVLCLAAAEALGADRSVAIHAACAVESMHTYSLIHDDLPAMDDDDLRRGRPTNHKVFGDAIAILAGDALLNESFVMVSRTAKTARYHGLDFVRELATAGNSQHLIGGQVMDIEAEGKQITREELAHIHDTKTAALLTTSIALGAMAADASPIQLSCLTRFGRALGHAFQVIDDILDVTADTATLGKTAGKDLVAEKSTYPALLGLDGAKAEAQRLTGEALHALDELDGDATRLRQIADYLLKREY